MGTSLNIYQIQLYRIITKNKKEETTTQEVKAVQLSPPFMQHKR